jgi:hypothetical protein
MVPRASWPQASSDHRQLGVVFRDLAVRMTQKLLDLVQSPAGVQQHRGVAPAQNARRAIGRSPSLLNNGIT